MKIEWIWFDWLIDHIDHRQMIHLEHREKQRENMFHTNIIQNMVWIHFHFIIIMASQFRLFNSFDNFRIGKFSSTVFVCQHIHNQSTNNWNEFQFRAIFFNIYSLYGIQMLKVFHYHQQHRPFFDIFFGYKKKFVIETNMVAIQINYSGLCKNLKTSVNHFSLFLSLSPDWFGWMIDIFQSLMMKKQFTCFSLFNQQEN